MNHKYSVIVFDLGNVLIPFTYEGAYRKLNEIDEGLGDRFREYYKSVYEMHRSFERGDITDETFIDTMLTNLERKVDKETFINLYAKVFTENKEVTALLPILKERYKLVLLSNTNSIHMEYGWRQYDFLQYFDKLILSHEVKAVKPEEKIYEAVENYTKLPPEEHIFIDDIADYVQGAKKRGWDGIQFISAEQLITDFKVRGIL
ncbi:MAG TPA: HAD family phosphatase [Ignavibacteriaceae bacterium]|nr:HAD family phosphatase [Ignavibacteriaceae bacterium]